MALKGLFLAIGCVAGFAFAVALSSKVAGWMRVERSRRISRGASLGANNFIGELMSRGIPALKPLALFALRQGFVEKAIGSLRTLVVTKGIMCNAESLATVVIAVLLAAWGVGFVVTANPLGGFAIDALAAAAVTLATRSQNESEAEAARDGVPQALTVMGDCFQSGYTLVQTMEQVAGQAEGRLAPLFARCADTLRVGGTSREALSCLREDKDIPELSFVAVALDVQHQSGGSISSVLGSAQRMVSDEIELRRSMRVQTAQARLSARVVCLMPFILVAVLSLVSEGFLSAFFESAAGIAMLVVALSMEAAGILLVRKMLEVER